MGGVLSGIIFGFIALESVLNAFASGVMSVIIFGFIAFVIFGIRLGYEGLKEKIKSFKKKQNTGSHSNESSGNSKEGVVLVVVLIIVIVLTIVINS